LTETESRQTNYHVISSAGVSTTDLTLHVGKVGRSGNRLTSEHRVYTFDKVFPENATNATVTDNVLSRLSLGGTVVCYGQTGTGKTYTFAALISKIAHNLAAIEVSHDGLDGLDTYVNLEFYELYGKKCFDLMNCRKELKVLSDSSEKVHARNATCIKFTLKSSPAETTHERVRRFEKYMESPLALRFQVATERNMNSSRSHSIFTVTLPQVFEEKEKEKEEDKSNEEKSSEEKTGGDGGDDAVGPVLVPVPNVNHPAYSLVGPVSLRLVDLAGSERNADTSKMTAKDHRESADINTALMSLKECIKSYKTQDKKPPYRGHLLTRVLRECFVDNFHKTVVVACVSPATTDGIHTLNSLNHVAIMQMEPDKTDKKYVRSSSGAGSKPLVEQNGVIEYVTVEVPLIEGGAGFNKDVVNWTPEDVKKWIAVANGGKFAHIVIPAGLNGKQLMSLNETSLSDLFEMTFEERQARGLNEGHQWVISNAAGGDEENVEGVGGNVAEIGRALFQQLRMEQINIDAIRKEEKRCNATTHRINER
jgi:hypothetical protein